MRLGLVACTAVVMAACQPSEQRTSESEVPTPPASEGSARTAAAAEGGGELQEVAGGDPAEASGDPLMLGAPYMPAAPAGTIGNRPETARVWVGLYCDTDPPTRQFSFWSNGRELERLETQCGPFDDASAPDAQFSFLVPTEVLVLRVQDDTGDAHSEIELGVTSNRFVTVTHRQVGADSGFLTSFEETSSRPSFAIVE